MRVAIDVMVEGHDTSERFTTVAARTSTNLLVASLSPRSVRGGRRAALRRRRRGAAGLLARRRRRDGALRERRASSSWYFAAGSSVPGAQTWLSLFNPFAVDAVVDVEADSENGFHAPGSLQGLVVPQGSRVAVRIDQAVSEQHIVAVAVRARNGAMIVATQAVIEPGAAGVDDASMSLGAIAPAHTWMFADNRSRAGGMQQLVIANPSGVDATARVAVVADVRDDDRPEGRARAGDERGGRRLLERRARRCQLHARRTLVGSGRRRTRATSPAPYAGLVTEIGSPFGARRWSFAGGPFTATGLGGGAQRVGAGFELAVVMKVDATQQQLAEMHTLLPRNGHITRVRTVSRQAALKSFQIEQRDNPALLRSTTARDAAGDVRGGGRRF